MNDFVASMSRANLQDSGESLPALLGGATPVTMQILPSNLMLDEILTVSMVAK